MRNVFNFGAGPAVLPEAVLAPAAAEMLDWRGTGQSVMEMSHRGESYQSIQAQAEADLRELAGIPSGYRILFLQGGATLQFAILPMNLLPEGGTADYVNTGEWSTKAIKEAKRFGKVNVAATAQDSRFTRIPPREEWRLTPGAAYVHICSNETIGGVEYHWTPDVGEVPLIADVSSNFMSRPIDVSRYGVLYGGAQKNLGPAGLTLVIIREDLLRGVRPEYPSLLDLKQQAENDSMVNTPPTFAVYIAGLVLQWMKREGGIDAIEKRNIGKARLLYDCLDASGFYTTPVAKEDRSRMNVPFTLPDKALDAPFLAGAQERGLVQLKGHRSVGGMRASIYNAMPVAGVQALVNYLRDFEKRYG